MRAVPRVRSRVGHVQALLVSLEEGLTAGASAAVTAGDLAAEDSTCFGRSRHGIWRSGWADRISWSVVSLHRIRSAGDGGFPIRLSRRGSRCGGRRCSRRAMRDFSRAGFNLFAAEVACEFGYPPTRQEETLARRAAALAREILPEGSGHELPHRRVARSGFAHPTGTGSGTPGRRGHEQQGHRRPALHIGSQCRQPPVQGVRQVGVAGRTELSGVLLPES